MDENYYRVLNISSSATLRDIKVAYRKLVQLYHPDVAKYPDEERIKIINVAYETLSNPTKKTIYDAKLAGGITSILAQSYPNSKYEPRRPPPYYYQHTRHTSSDSPSFSLKTQLLGWGAALIAIAIVVVAIFSSNYYVSSYYYKKGLAAEETNKRQDALHFYQLAIRDWGSKSVEASIKSALLSEKFGSNYYTIKYCKKGLMYHPTSTQKAKIYYLEAAAYNQTESFKKSETAYLKSLSLGFDKDSIYHQLGLLYINHLDKYLEAEKIYTYLLGGNTLNLADYYTRGICYQYLGKWQLSINDFLKVLDNNSYHGLTLFQLGRSYLALGNKEKACEYLHLAQQQSVHIDPVDLAKACE